jgi:transposase
MLTSTVRRTWAPRGHTPLLFHRYRHDKLSAISAVTVRRRRQRLGLYCHLIWDGGSIHRGAVVQQLLAHHPRLHVERFPAYAPELNPDEQVWNHFKTPLANGCPLTLDELLDDLTHVARRARRSPALLRGFIRESDLPPFLSS